jgi:molybdopterin/thiamine biosynthesis adenylyltransferase
VAGAGAVGEAYLAVLSTSNVDTDVAALDHDDLDDGNLNRHVVAGATDVGCGKALLAQQRLATGATRITALRYKWEAWVGTHPDDKPSLPHPLAEQSRGQRYGLVISAVDKNEARVAVAGSHPALIFSGSSNGLTVEVGRYGHDSPWQCLGCASPVAPARTVEETASDVAGMSDEELAPAAARAGVDVEHLRAYIRHPVCGTLGEREMAKFAAFTRPDWSVSFVSVAAGKPRCPMICSPGNRISRMDMALTRDRREAPRTGDPMSCLCHSFATRTGRCHSTFGSGQGQDRTVDLPLSGGR